MYDTRDDLTVPSRGLQLIAYGGLASRGGQFNDSMYSEAGVDGRSFLPVAMDTVLVTHMAIRYMPTAHDVPFWVLSAIGGGDSVLGGTQPLRGFGLGRYYDPYRGDAFHRCRSGLCAQQHESADGPAPCLWRRISRHPAALRGRIRGHRLWQRGRRRIHRTQLSILLSAAQALQKRRMRSLVLRR